MSSVYKCLVESASGGVLIFDTSFDEGCLIWVKPTGEVISKHFDSSTRASEGLVESLEDWMSVDELKDLAALVIGLGPGSFTGVRVAAATAKGISTATKVKVFGVSSLHWLSSSLEPDKRWAVVVDARQDEVYVRASGLESDRLLTISECAEYLKAHAVELVSTNWTEEQARSRLAFDGEIRPLELSSDAGINLALTAVESGRALEPHQITPAYLKATPAERNLSS